MGHKVLINGTAYDIKGGRTLINGTGYSITKGRTLINGTGYDISFSNVSTVLNDNDWATIRQVSDAGAASNYWSVGDSKSIAINGAVGNTSFPNLSVDAFIIGFNHNSAREGSNKIQFQIGKISGIPVALVDSQYNNGVSTTGYFSMNGSNANSGGWNSSQMRTTVLGSNGTPTSPAANTLLAALPSALRAVMKPVTKYTDNVGGGSGSAGNVSATTDYLFLPAEFEYHGFRTYANNAEQNYQSQYAYYQAGNSKIKYRHNSTSVAAFIWTRSVWASDNSYFCRNTTSGIASTYAASASYGVAPGFCV